MRQTFDIILILSTKSCVMHCLCVTPMIVISADVKIGNAERVSPYQKTNFLCSLVCEKEKEGERNRGKYWPHPICKSLAKLSIVQTFSLVDLHDLVLALISNRSKNSEHFFEVQQNQSALTKVLVVNSTSQLNSLPFTSSKSTLPRVP